MNSFMQHDAELWFFSGFDEIEFSRSVDEVSQRLARHGVKNDEVLYGGSGILMETVLGVLFPAAPLIGGGIGFSLKAWIDARNGRRLKIKVGDIEIEATQMSEKDVRRTFELLQTRADSSKIRQLLQGDQESTRSSK